MKELEQKKPCTATGRKEEKMGKEKAPNREQKDMLTLRIAPKVNLYTKAKAESIGVSQAAFLNILIDLGLRVYESDFTLTVHKE